MNVCHKPLISCFVFVSFITMNGLVMADNADDIRLRVQKVGKLNIVSEPAAAPASDAAPAATETPAAATAAATSTPQSTAAAPAAESSGEAAVVASGAAPADTNNDVAQLYQASCFACHGTGVLEAPKLGDKAAWEPRIAQGNDVMMEHVIKGFNAMPPRGATTLSDEQLAQIVDYMVKSVQ